MFYALGGPLAGRTCARCSAIWKNDKVFEKFKKALGSPNPGQSFGRGLWGREATEVKMDPRGTWAAVKSHVISGIALRDRRVLAASGGAFSAFSFFDVFRF